eukprot:COSAG02_NODE_60982_length_269_cov_31.388235_1_plen_64_part_10
MDTVVEMTIDIDKPNWNQECIASSFVGCCDYGLASSQISGQKGHKICSCMTDCTGTVVVYNTVH